MNKKRKQYQKKYKKQYRSQVKRVNLTLSNTEYRDFSRASKNSKVTPYIKKLALAGLYKQTMIPESIEIELKILRFAIANIANNVNQMAHYSNTIRSVSQEHEHSLLQHIKQLDEVVQTYVEGRIAQATS